MLREKGMAYIELISLILKDAHYFSDVV